MDIKLTTSQLLDFITEHNLTQIEPKRAATLVTELNIILRQHSRFYYQDNKPIISDYEFDQLFTSLKILEQHFPHLIDPNSLTQKVGSDLAVDIISEKFTKVKHLGQMFSLDNSYSMTEIGAWMTRLNKVLGTTTNDVLYSVEPKLDGLGVAIVYEKGHLIKAITRGDGLIGEDITANFLTIKSVPKKINFLGTLEVVGEVMMSKKVFNSLNEQRAQTGQILFANSRNAAAGSLRQLDSAVVRARKLSFFAYQIGFIDGHDFTTYDEIYQFFNTIRIPTQKMLFCSNITEVAKYCEKLGMDKVNLAMDIDGVVIKINSLAQREQAGYTIHHPRWAIAYKYPASTGTTRLQEIIFGVGRTGAITPVAVLAPVKIAGATINRATLHNFDELQRKNIKIGDLIIIKRAGEVIPEVVKPLIEYRTGAERTIKIITHCPSCNEKLMRIAGEVNWYCINNNCPKQVLGSLEHAVSKHALNIDGVGTEVLQELYQRGLVKHFVDLFTLQRADLLGLPLFQERKITNTLTAINKAKNSSLAALILALGIRFVGRRTAQILAKNSGSIDKLSLLKITDLVALADIGTKIATAVVEFFQAAQNIKLLQKLSNLGFDPHEQVQINSQLAGKIFVLTGSLVNYTRDDLTQILENLGAIVAASVSQKTTWVIAGKKAGSKLKKAQDLSIPVMNEEQLELFLQEYSLLFDYK